MLRSLIATTLALLISVQIAWAQPTVYPKGLTILKPAQIFPGFVISTLQDGVAYMISPTGQAVRSWTDPNPPNQLGYAEPLPGGHILAFSRGDSFPGCGFNCGIVVELDFLNNLVWDYADADRFLHHDFQRLSNGNTLLLCSKSLNRAEISPLEITDDCLIEVDSAGNILWEWQTADHWDEFGYSDELKAAIAAKGGDWAHANSAFSIPANTPHVDPRFRPGNVIISYRNTNDIIIVDRDTGQIVWKVSNVTVGQHDAHMITTGQTGAGNIIVFDNGCCNSYPGAVSRGDLPWSRIVEIDPVTNSVTPVYTAADSGLVSSTFFSYFISSVQRLPNGNTFIDEGMNGRLFEVSPSGEIVWEFISPIFGTPLNDGGQSNLTYRAKKAPASWFPIPQQ